MALQSRVQLSVDAVLDVLAYDFTAFEIDDFLRHVAQNRRRPVSVYTVPLAPELFGFWYPARETDFIAINATLHPVHRLHTLLHELAHMLLGHRGMDLRTLLGEDLVRQLDIGPVDGHLRSAGMIDQTNNPQEREAEQFVLAIRLKLVAAQRLQELYGEPTSIRSMQPYGRGLDFNS